MPDASVYFSAIQAEKARLDRAFPEGYLFITSLKNFAANSTAGTVSEVPTKTAAKHVVENTARVATPEEIADFKARAQAFSNRMASQQFARKKSDSSGVTFTLTK